MAASDENEKYANPRKVKSDITNGQYARYQTLLESLVSLRSLFSPKRFLVIKWLLENEYLNSIEPNAFLWIRGDMFETFLIAAEKVTALRKEKGSSDEIINIASEYIITHKLIWSDYNAWENGFVRHFLAQVLWCFFEAYPKFVPVKTSDKEPLEHAVTCMLALPDSDIDKLTTSIAILVPNVKSGGIDDLFSSWVDGKLMYLSRRVLNFPMHDKKKSKKLLDAGKENGNTINLRLELARHVAGSTRRRLLANALDMAKAVYGECHAITWHCTEQLGDFYLKYADEYILRYYFSKLQGDNVRGVQSIYEEFLNHAYELEQSSTLNASERKALSSLLREKVVPTLANLYTQNGKESEARKLLWKTVKDSSSQIYHDNWRPFLRGSGKMRRLMTEIHSLEDFGGYSDLKYSSLELVLFPFDGISLMSVQPSDEEKARKWHFVFERLPNGEIHGVGEIADWSPGLEGGYEPRTTQKADEDTENREKMILQLPYITYSHFKTSKAYRNGSAYEFYRKGSVNQQLQDWMKKNEEHYVFHFGRDDYPDYMAYADGWPSVGGALVDSEKGEVERFLYDRETGSMKMTDEKQASTKELVNPSTYKVLNNITQCKKQIPGFFNSTPGDTAAIDETGMVTQGFNLVSAEWYDWKRFILHPCASSMERQPELVSTDGSHIPVLGYIYGTWTDDRLQKQWKGLQIWVVQARFELATDASQDGKSCHFVLNVDDLCKSREHDLSPSETRAICTFLNPSLLRVMNHTMLTPFVCTMGEGIPDDFAGVTKKLDTSTQRDLIAELSFRDAWDTEFAYKWWNRTWGDARNKIMREQMKEETARRREWDAESAPVFKQWVNSRK